MSLFEAYTGKPALSQKALNEGGGSNRRYYRLEAEDVSLVGVIGSNAEENAAFIYLSKHFLQKGLPVPRVLAVDEEGVRYLQDDLGDRSLYDALSKGRATGIYSEEEKALLRKAMELLPRVQLLGGEGLDFSRCYPQAGMDETSVMFDLNYFKYCFLKTSGLEFNELRLEEDFRRLAKDITAECPLSSPSGTWPTARFGCARKSEQVPLHSLARTFMYRDYQARNLMLSPSGELSLIDYQGGRRGPLQYDVASFLWQASARYTDELREELLKVYLESLARLTDIDEAAFRQRLRLFVLFRLLQVLGAYGFRGRYERKQYFLESIPPALASLRSLLKRSACPYPYLAELLAELSEDTPARVQEDGLTVRVTSFSYRKGIPADESGHGGGYVFDCRGTHNPGKYPQYQQLNGLDEPVRRFLEEDGEILRFLRSVYALAEAHVERYLERDFTSLSFSFGCTGGQHRSVYAAQRLAERLNRKYGIRVELLHREQGISTVLQPEKRTAMVFAAGLGTRLLPLTLTRPKALVEIGGKPLIEIVSDKLRRAGFRDIVVNTHHLAPMLEGWLEGRKGFKVSRESPRLLDTGGAVKQAIPLFGRAERVLFHNVDILSDADLTRFWQAGEGADATLLVSERKTRRYLLFDDDLRLVGWTDTETGQVKSPFPSLNPDRCRRLAFSGIHQISQTLWQEMADWPASFSIIDFYLHSCRRFLVKGYVQPGLRLLDAGKHEALRQAEAFLSS